MKFLVRLIIHAIGSFALALPILSWADDNAAFEVCREKLKTAQKLDVLYDLQFSAERPVPRVVVGPTFMTMPIDAKEGFAETVNCFLMVGDRHKCISFKLLHWQTGKAVGEFELCRYRPL